jgi:hypothetical protein
VVPLRWAPMPSHDGAPEGAEPDMRATL